MLRENTICFPRNFDCFQNASAPVVCEALLVITSAGNSKAAVHRCSTISVLFKISQNSQENSCVGGHEPATLFKKRLCHSWFSVKFVKLFRKPLSQNTSGRLHPETVHPVDLANLRKKFCIFRVESTRTLSTNSAESFSACSVTYRFIQVQVQMIVLSLSEAAVYSPVFLFYSKWVFIKFLQN